MKSSKNDLLLLSKMCALGANILTGNIHINLIYVHIFQTLIGI